MPKPVIAVPTDTAISQIKELRDGGYIVIVTSNPDKVRAVTTTAGELRDDILMSALHGICSSGVSKNERSSAMMELHRRLLARERKPAV